MGESITVRMWGWTQHVGQTAGQCIDAVAPRSPDLHVAQAEQAGWQLDAPDVYCPRCGATSGPAGFTDDGCAFCVGKPVAWDRLIRLGAYSQPLDQWIVAMKFARDWSWANWLGRRLGERIGQFEDGDKSVISQVPMHWLRRLRRGYDQSHLIAAAAARAAELPAVSLLKRTRYTHPQTMVAPSRRAQNIANSFAARSIDPTGWCVWLIDDVKTTGATLSACARLLRKAGAARIYIAVAAVADPHHADFQVT